VTGLLSTVERKTCWSLAEQAGYRNPAPLQRLLRTAVWDADAAAGDVRRFVARREAHHDTTGAYALIAARRARASGFTIRMRTIGTFR
jgi:hypothetical protein